MSRNRICVCCGKHYVYDYRSDPRSRALYCSDECKNIFDVASKYNHGDLDAEDAQDLLLSINSDFDDLTPNLREIVNEIMEHDE